MRYSFPILKCKILELVIFADYRHWWECHCTWWFYREGNADWNVVASPSGRRNCWSCIKNSYCTPGSYQNIPTGKLSIKMKFSSFIINMEFCYDNNRSGIIISYQINICFQFLNFCLKQKTLTNVCRTNYVQCQCKEYGRSMLWYKNNCYDL